VEPFKPSTTRERVGALLMLTISLVFVVSALWIIVARPRDAPLVAAWVGFFFFGMRRLSRERLEEEVQVGAVYLYHPRSRAKR
jgi:hypothetical protein